MGRFKTEDYKEKFEKEVEKVAYNRVQDPEKRLSIIKDLIEEYVKDTGETPNSSELSRLTDAILYEYLQGDTRPDKVTYTERPILTHAQVKRRHNSELTSQLFGYIGSDKKWYGMKPLGK